MRSEKPICTQPRLIDDDPLSSFQVSKLVFYAQSTGSVISGRCPFKEDRLTLLSLHASLLQAFDGVMSFASCPQVVSQAPQHFKSSEMQASYVTAFSAVSYLKLKFSHSLPPPFPSPPPPPPLPTHTSPLLLLLAGLVVGGRTERPLTVIFFLDAEYRRVIITPSLPQAVTFPG